MTDWPIRSGQDTDGPGIIALMAACWSAYPGLHMDVDGEMPQLRRLASSYADQGGALWIAEIDRRVQGMVAVRPEGSTWEVCQVYVDPSLHGSGLGHVLLGRAERHAIQAGAQRLCLWSDTRFERAHRFYEKRSYVRRGGVRALNDISNSLEFGYAKPVNGIEALDVAAANAAERRLARILVACVEGGASVSFLPPLSLERAGAFWRRAASDASAGRRVVLAGWRDGSLVATGMLDLAMPENQPHRAEVQKVLVLPSARRAGLARGMMRALEAAARAAGRTLLVLDTRTGEAGEALYRAEGWQEYGRLGGYAVDASGVPTETTFFYKRLTRATLA